MKKYDIFHFGTAAGQKRDVFFPAPVDFFTRRGYNDIDDCHLKYYSRIVTFGEVAKIGNDQESMYYLDIEMLVCYNRFTRQYSMQGDAYWEKKLVGILDSYKAAEEYHDDYIGITWGGEGSLCATEQEIAGTYYDDQEVAFSRRISDSYAGYVWQFREKSGLLGKELKRARAYLKVARGSVSQGKTTNVKMTYIHTYGKINGSVSIKASTDGTAAASVSLSETEKQWQIEIDVPKIAY